MQFCNDTLTSFTVRVFEHSQFQQEALLSLASQLRATSIRCELLKTLHPGGWCETLRAFAVPAEKDRSDLTVVEECVHEGVQIAELIGI